MDSGVGVRDSLAFDAPSFMPPAGLDLLAAALSFNKISPDEGFEEFAGEDGRVGLEDFVNIIADLQLGLDGGGARRLFQALDREGALQREGWCAALARVDSSQALADRGVVLTENNAIDVVRRTAMPPESAAGDVRNGGCRGIAVKLEREGKAVQNDALRGAATGGGGSRTSRPQTSGAEGAPRPMSARVSSRQTRDWSGALGHCLVAKALSGAGLRLRSRSPACRSQAAPPRCLRLLPAGCRELKAVKQDAQAEHQALKVFRDCMSSPRLGELQLPVSTPQGVGTLGGGNGKWPATSARGTGIFTRLARAASSPSLPASSDADAHAVSDACAAGCAGAGGGGGKGAEPGRTLSGVEQRCNGHGDCDSACRRCATGSAGPSVEPERSRFSQILSIVNFCSKCTWALTLIICARDDAANRERERSARAAISPSSASAQRRSGGEVGGSENGYAGGARRGLASSPHDGGGGAEVCVLGTIQSGIGNGGTHCVDNKEPGKEGKEGKEGKGVVRSGDNKEPGKEGKEGREFAEGKCVVLSGASGASAPGGKHMQERAKGGDAGGRGRVEKGAGGGGKASKAEGRPQVSAENAGNDARGKKTRIDATPQQVGGGGEGGRGQREHTPEQIGNAAPSTPGGGGGGGAERRSKRERGARAQSLDGPLPYARTSQHDAEAGGGGRGGSQSLDGSMPKARVCVCVYSCASSELDANATPEYI
jgi:hypothetical protein